jgi:hypothetical protein
LWEANPFADRANFPVNAAKGFASHNQKIDGEPGKSHARENPVSQPRVASQLAVEGVIPVAN